MANSRIPPPTQIYRTPGIANVEDLEGYAPGGYCPVTIDDTIDNGLMTYTFLHKLGFGPSSTVWLARREWNDANKPASFHALKILRAELSGPGKHPELEIIQHLESASRKSPHHGCCFVLPLLGPSLHDQRALSAIAGETRRDLCSQLAYAVDHLHTFDVCHSDLSPRNVLVKIPKVEYMSETSLRNRLGPVVSERIKLADGKPPSKHSPKKVIQPASFSGLDFNSLKEIVLVGFGNAFPEITPPPTLQCPLDIFPPEVLFGYPASKQSDIWQLACLMFFIHTGTSLFQTEPFHEHLVWHITQYLGQLPSHWADRYLWDKYKSATCLGETYGRNLGA